MPNTREKLLDLIHQAREMANELCGEQDGCEKCPYQAPKGCAFGFIADHLIANGVTVGKPLTEYLHPVDNYAGLKGKYLVFKADTGEQVSNCFVLRPDKDTAAVEALRAYARNTNNETLAEDIYNWVGKGVTVQKWIPVTERLPEDDLPRDTKRRMIRCLVYTDKGTVKPCVRQRYDKKIDGKWQLSGWEWNKDIFAKPTHWMQLPKPPKETRYE